MPGWWTSWWRRYWRLVAQGTAVAAAFPLAAWGDFPGVWAQVVAGLWICSALWFLVILRDYLAARFRPTPAEPPAWMELATYNAERHRGVIHDVETVARMAELQFRFDADQRARWERMGRVIDLPGGGAVIVPWSVLSSPEDRDLARELCRVLLRPIEGTEGP